MLKRSVSILLLLALVFSLSSCSDTVDFSVYELTLTFPNDFYEVKDKENCDMLLTNDEVTVAITRFSFADPNVPANVSVDIFASYFLDMSGAEGTLYVYRDIPYYTYYDSSAGAELFCTATFYSTPYAYFLVLYATASSNEEAWRDEFLEIADSAIYNF